MNEAIKRAQTLGWSLAKTLHLDPRDCGQEAVAVLLEVKRDLKTCNGWASPLLWKLVHARLIGRRGALRYLQPVGRDAPVAARAVRK